VEHLSLYRKYRPDVWDKIIGQDHITTSLKNQIKAHSVGHAYLFTGTRGTGKTSAAKIFARAVNCLNPIDGSPCQTCDVCKALKNAANTTVLELDAASNNSVEDIRLITDSIQYTPSLGKYKVYIIDEVHMLSSAAYNAFLKTLEEPPSYIIFILATTEVQKLPQTIVSRCMRFDFRLVPQKLLQTHLLNVFRQEDYECEESAASLIASQGAGSVRDMFSIADMCKSYSPQKLTYDDVLFVLGTADFDLMFKLISSMLEGNCGTALEYSRQLVETGKSAILCARDIINFLNSIIAVRNAPAYKGDFSDAELMRIKELSTNSKYENYKLIHAIDVFSSLENKIKYSTHPHILFDAALIRAADLGADESTTALKISFKGLQSKFDDLENKLSAYLISGAFHAQVPIQSDTSETKPAVPDGLKLLETPSISIESTPLTMTNTGALDEQKVLSQTIRPSLATSVRNEPKTKQKNIAPPIANLREDVNDKVHFSKNTSSHKNETKLVIDELGDDFGINTQISEDALEAKIAQLLSSLKSPLNSQFDISKLLIQTFYLYLKLRNASLVYVKFYDAFIYVINKDRTELKSEDYGDMPVLCVQSELTEFKNKYGSDLKIYY
jgi:DNA polymerase-3 subunit gamma/tau